MDGVVKRSRRGQAGAAMKRRNVLIVEPERDEGELFARALEARRNYKCYVTGKEKEATTLLRDVPIDLMLLDVTMATNQDCSLLKRVKRDHPQLSIILVATTYQRELVQRARVHEVQGYITKPIRIDEFRHHIEVFFQELDSREGALVDDG
jgi:DNA-binding NtrC family response regulator